MIALEEAIGGILEAVEPLAGERVALANAGRRILLRDVVSTVNLPPFDNSAMDGYAVRADDLQTASAKEPVSLKLAGSVPAGKEHGSAVDQGTCVRIFTGSPMPAGADAVVMQEDVSADGGRVLFSEPVKPFENVRLRGEDLRAGENIGRRGDAINATRASVFAACGISGAEVSRAPVVTLLATGSELREGGEPLGPGEIYESNRALLTPLLRAIGCEVRTPPILRDDLMQTVEALSEAFKVSDAVITTGGVSVGEFDFVKEAFSKIGGKIDLWRVAIRPGKPFVFGQLGPRFLFGLPGNPVSALVTFLLLVRPALLKMQSCTELALPSVSGELREAIHNRGDRRHFVRVRFESGRVTLCGPQASHMISSLARANGLIDLTPGTQLEQGAQVRVLLWQG